MNPLFFLKRMLGSRRSPRKPAEDKLRQGRSLSRNLNDNLAAVRTGLKDASDLVIRELVFGGKPPRRIAVIYLRSMADLKVVAESVIGPLTSHAQARFAWMKRDGFLEHLRLRLPSARAVDLVDSMKSLVTGILEGRAVLLADGISQALTIAVTNIPARAFQQPTSEVTVMGPQIGFTESIEDNVALVRTRLRSPDLAVERMVMGRKSRTEVRMLYLQGVAPDEIVSEMRRRLRLVDTDMILDVGMIRDLLDERPYSPFIMERLTERPDSAAAEINLGRVAVLVDGSPFAMLQPSQFFTLFEAAEDYYMNSWSTTLLRLVRMIAYALSTLATPLYVAVVTFHHELIPLPLLLNIAATQEGVPLPLAVTAFVTEIVLDVVREAGVRLPQQFGPAVSIVGALVLGQAAIQAGFVPPGLVIVVMFATIASFAVPRAEKAIAYRLVRFPLLLLASVLGFPGLTLGALAVVYHLASLKTLGVPYFSLYTPGNVPRLARKLIMAPAKLQPVTRPLGHRDRTRRGPLPKPRDPKLPPGEGDTP